MTSEKARKPGSGYVMLFIGILILIGTIYLIVRAGYQ